MSLALSTWRRQRFMLDCSTRNATSAPNARCTVSSRRIRRCRDETPHRTARGPWIRGFDATLYERLAQPRLLNDRPYRDRYAEPPGIPGDFPLTFVVLEL